MFSIEKVIIIALCLLPVIALVIILPKKLSLKNGAKKKSAKAKAEEKSAEKSADKPVVVEDSAKAEKLEGSNLTEDDAFKSYVNKKAEKTPSPKPKITDMSGFGNFDGDLFSRPQRQPKHEENKTLKEEINSLSPELKALLLTGALEPKHFDNKNNT